MHVYGSAGYFFDRGILNNTAPLCTMTCSLLFIRRTCETMCIFDGASSSQIRGRVLSLEENLLGSRQNFSLWLAVTRSKEVNLSEADVVADSASVEGSTPFFARYAPLRHRSVLLTCR